MQKVDRYRYKFVENDIELIAEEHTLIALAEMLRMADVEGTWSDLVYQIEYAFDIDGVRSANEDEDEWEEPDWDDDYVPSSTNGDYSPSNPWDAPGMKMSDFI